MKYQHYIMAALVISAGILIGKIALSMFASAQSGAASGSLSAAA